MPIFENWWNISVVKIAQALNALTQRWLYSNDLNFRVSFFQIPTNAHERATSAEAGNEVSDLWTVAPNFWTSAFIMRARVCIILILMHETPFGMLECQCFGALDRTI